MRTKLILCMGAILASQGCSPLAHVARTMIGEPAEYPRRIDDAADDFADRKMAEIAWDKLQEQEPGCEYSNDFRLGFLDGYADYLYAGGKGNPPPVPPRWYWRAENETFDGHAAINDWFEGFRRGAAAAKASGYRELVTLPFSSPPPGGPPQRNPATSSLPPAGPAPATLPPPSEARPKEPLPSDSPPAVPAPAPAPAVPAPAPAARQMPEPMTSWSVLGEYGGY
jgi:hypothetical protein